MIGQILLHILQCYFLHYADTNDADAEFVGLYSFDRDSVEDRFGLQAYSNMEINISAVNVSSILIQLIISFIP